MARRPLVPVLLLISALGAACAGEQGGDAASDEILIGEYGSLTGTTATFGISTRNGIDMAVDEVNAAGGVLGRQVRIIVEDDQGRPEEAQTVVTKLIASDRVVAILGEVGWNFGAGMTGGEAFVLDDQGKLSRRLNAESVIAEPLVGADPGRLRALLEDHQPDKAKEILREYGKYFETDIVYYEHLSRAEAEAGNKIESGMASAEYSYLAGETIVAIDQIQGLLTGSSPRPDYYQRERLQDRLVFMERELRLERDMKLRD